jgi:aryl-alcohol dehydrogenase-like predicted oxidoreductase
MIHQTTRRNFLFAGMAMAGTMACSRHGKLSSNAADLNDNPLGERILGKTGLSLPLLGLGGAGQTPLSWEGREKDASAIIGAAIHLGIRYFDTAASYGPSEAYLGQVVPPHRQKLFLATKTAARNRESAWRDLERSLQRLKTDYLDLWQLHHVAFQEELEQIFSPKGAITALEEAKEQKLVRFTGITGHHEPDVIVAGLKRYPFDTTLIPLNAADLHHPRPFQTAVLPVTQAENVGVIAMKVPAYGHLFKPGGLEGMEQAMGYTLSLPGVHCCIIAAETVQQLEVNVRVAQGFRPLTPAEMKEIERRTASTWEDHSFFRSWT